MRRTTSCWCGAGRSPMYNVVVMSSTVSDQTAVSDNSELSPRPLPADSISSTRHGNSAVVVCEDDSAPAYVDQFDSERRSAAAAAYDDYSRPAALVPSVYVTRHLHPTIADYQRQQQQQQQSSSYTKTQTTTSEQFNAPGSRHDSCIPRESKKTGRAGAELYMCSHDMTHKNQFRMIKLDERKIFKVDYTPGLGHKFL